MESIDSPTYKIHFIDSLQDIFAVIFKQFSNVKFLLLTDDNISKIYLKDIESIFQTAKRQFFPFILNHGEINKNRLQKTRVENFLLKNKFERDDVLISVGGGLVGDFTGYVASSYLRGVRYIQVPTTILSMVDASIGSKTGVNTEYGKNLIGSIYDPAMIVMNVNFLKSLDNRNINNGVAEMIKAALLFDKEYFNQLSETNFVQLVHTDPNALKPLIKRSVELKLKVVNADKREAGLRKLLNFGHTIGHAIEFSLKGELLHGECVAIGMCLETELAYHMGLCEESLKETIRECCKRHKLPTEIPPQISITSVMKYMENDKKNQSNDIHFVFLQDVNKPYEKTFAASKTLIKQIISPAYKIGPSILSKAKDITDIKFPGSKSITNRALLMAALGKGTVKLQGVLDAEDTHIMLKALVDLKACEILEKSGDTIILKGNEGKLQPPSNHIYTENSGTSARFLTSILLMLNGSAVMDGSSRMKERPIGDLLDALKLQKTVAIEFLEKENSIPFKITSQGFYGGEIKIKSKISSQYVSSILMSAPYAQHPVKLILEDVQQNDKIVSEPYVQMTISLMEKFGIKVQRTAYNIFEVPQGIYTNPEEFFIEPDASTASYEQIYLCLNEGKPKKILYLGSESVQGDSGFAQVLQKIGAHINIAPNSITIEGGHLHEMKPIDINLADQTDTFMGLSVVLSQIEGVSSIRGIANQRVKECDRIRAVRKNLLKCGVYCRELEDGIEIHGKSLAKQTDVSSTKTKVLIKTYNDHRIAMSFAVLGAYYASKNHHIGLVIQNRACVGKTFPGFWRHLELTHGVQLEGLSEDEAFNKNVDKNDPIFIIGMRWAGKSTQGKVIAEKLGHQYIDMDLYLINEEQKKDPKIKSVQDIVEKYGGWKGWRDMETAFLEEVAKNQEKYRNHVISTGGGVIEAKHNQEILHGFKNVIMIDRSFYDIEQQSIESEKKDTMRPQLSAVSTISEIYLKRLPLYIKNAKHIFSFPSFHKIKETIKGHELEYWIRVTKMYKRYIRRIYGDEPNPFIPDDSFFLTVDLRVLDNLTPQYAKYINAQYNAIELRIDFIAQEHRNNRAVNEMFGLLREKIAFVKFLVDIPIIITLRTKSEGGSFEAKTKEDYEYIQKLYFLLNKTNLVEIFDVEYCAENLRFLKQFRGRAQRKQIILSKHYPQNCPENTVLQDLEIMNECEESDIIKVVLSEHHSMELLNQVSFEKPLIKLKLGNSGKYSRVECKFLCPVYDPLFGAAVAPGQMSKEEIMNIRLNTGLSPKFKSFYLFGTGVSKSLSPIIHNTYFEYYNLYNCHYERREVQTIEEAVKVIKEDTAFKGASVTMPFKKEIIPYLDVLHTVAKELGVVNTVIKFCDKLYGYNTDWWGMYKPLTDNFNKRPDLKSRPYGLIIGAGATAETGIYVLERFGLKVVVYNRSKERIMGLKQQKPEILITTSLETLEVEEEGTLKKISPNDIAVVISTVPGNNDLVFPESLFREKPIIFDVANNPRITKFIAEAQKYGCESIIYGIEMLLHQGFVQDELFIGKKPPKRHMIKIVQEHYAKAIPN